MVDLVVIGGGSAGYFGAIRAAQLGKQVVLIEKEEIGGTCLHRGCIPTKALLHSASVFESQKDFASLGLSGSITANSSQMNRYKNEIVDKLANGIESLLAGNKIEILQGEAIIINEHLVQVNDHQVETDFILIASGATTNPFPGAFTSKEILDFDDKLFDDVVIIGGGVIGCEFAQLYHSLGSKVTILEAQEQILGTFDKDLIQNVTMLFKRRGIQILTNVSDITVDNNLVTYTHKEQTRQIETQAVIAAVGRKPTIIESEIDLLLEHNRYQVDINGQTSVPNIFAVGDCSSKIQLAHLAQAQAKVAVEVMFGATPTVNLAVCPAVVYLKPEIATIGLTEKQASEAYTSIKVGKYALSGHGKTLINQNDRSFVKLVVDSDTNTLVGAHLMCENASDMLPILQQVLANKDDVECLAHLIYPHPSFVEAIAEAVDDLKNSAIHIMPKRK